MALIMLNRSAILARSANVAGMSFIDFMRFNEIKLDEFTMNAFFHNIRRDMPIYMTETIISNFGYVGELKEQKRAITNLLKTNFVEYENKLWWSCKNKDYGELLSNKIHPIINAPIVDIKYPPVSNGMCSMDELR